MKIILDTDFGDDIDDTFALYYLLKIASTDIALVLSSFGQTAKRAELICDFLKKCNRTDINVGIGQENLAYRDPYMYKLFNNIGSDNYPRLYRNGLEKAKKLIEENEDVIIIAIGPPTNLASLTNICEKAKTVPVFSMLGSIYKGYNNADTVSKEWNAIADVPATKKFLSEYKYITLTPLDTCGIVRFESSVYTDVLNSNTPLGEYFEKWLKLDFHKNRNKSVIFDAAAIYMALDGNLMKYKTLPLICDNQGYLKVNAQGNKIKCALTWKNLNTYLNFLEKIITN
ncbi:MAG: nucleoside hydrolase [Clostridia bacterium]|nr:nucleoside hydrolase [Clostridia bacterium]